MKFTNVSAWDERNSVFEDLGLKIHETVQERSCQIEAFSVLIISVDNRARDKEDNNASYWEKDGKH